MTSITATLTLVDGVQIVVPNSLNLITPYVLLEQQDWFEDEIKFLRCLLQQGQKVIDIGANYGTYTLSMALKVGEIGRVWSFEPASNTAKLLAESIVINGFTQVVLEKSALSNTSGSAQLSLNDYSELNALTHDQSSTSACETVPVVTLDECLEKYDWQDIDFMKIDAEGEESNILKGGERFFRELSPLIQYEIKAGSKLHMELVQSFTELGYDSYQLIPKLNFLIPFDTKSTPDGYLLNLFCCKPDRAKRLAADGFLLDTALTTETERFKNLSEKLSNNIYDWHHTIAKLSYTTHLSNHWEQMVVTENTAEVYKALSFYAISHDSSLPSVERFEALEASFKLLNSLCKREPSYLRLASLARVAGDYGARVCVVNALQQLFNTISPNKRLDTNEPFLAPEERFDSIPSSPVIDNWVLAAALEKFERLGHYSSFYTETASQQRLELIRDLGFGSEEMARRLRLLQKRFGLSVS